MKKNEESIAELEALASTLSSEIDSILLSMMRCTPSQKSELKAKLDSLEIQQKETSEKLNRLKPKKSFAFFMPKFLNKGKETGSKSQTLRSPRHGEELNPSPRAVVVPQIDLERMKWASAIKIQKVYRGFKSRKLMRENESVKSQKRLSLAWNELLKSERTYLQQLTIMSDKLQKPLITKFTTSRRTILIRPTNSQRGSLPVFDSSNTIITQDKINEVFGKAKLMQGIHGRILESIENVNNNWPKVGLDRLSETFNSLFQEEVILMYAEYINNYPKAVGTLNELYENPAFVNFVETSLSDCSASLQHLPSYLITPVQRVPRYVLVMNEMLKHMDPSNVYHKVWTDLAAFMYQTSQAINLRISQVANELSKSEDSGVPAYMRGTVSSRDKRREKFSPQDLFSNGFNNNRGSIIIPKDSGLFSPTRGRAKPSQASSTAGSNINSRSTSPKGSRANSPTRKNSGEASEAAQKLNRLFINSTSPDTPRPKNSPVTLRRSTASLLPERPSPKKDEKKSSRITKVLPFFQRKGKD
eukprot:TRINITY_DN6142_c0_g1_i2.p1 TRINITY_DN6142_c0_g1~~TRINITY_DN6142_c0_g1_i2.p1  ORF type:complete len:529 (+),score=138.26 TRINITY_DN6142_c0_g1_i2:90-1676(+)